METNLLNWPCAKVNLSNEASVETFFIDRWIKYINWPDQDLKLKDSISNHVLTFGRKKINYKPDYILLNKMHEPIIVIDAKAVNEKLDDYVEQCASYCFLLNKSKETVKYFILSNGIETRLYNWKGAEVIIHLKYEDFSDRSEAFSNFCTLINGLYEDDSIQSKEKDTMVLKNTSKEEAQKLFKRCHKYIWNSEKCGVNFAFMQFVKLIFLKMQSDKKVHEIYKLPKSCTNAIVNKSDVLFSTYWIEHNTTEFMLNPVNDIQFKHLMRTMQEDIKKRKKKPLFDADEEIQLKAGTIKEIVKTLEHNDLYGIDEDLNGRLFETFLNATMRGNDLGQYFTPRSVVKLGVELADLKVSKEHIDKVLDASCGTGGYLIEAFYQMRQKLVNNKSFSDVEKERLLDQLCNNCIYGIDAAKDPKLARIARINMYLHGDGGSQIYMGDALNINMDIDKTDSQEFQNEMEDMRSVFKPNSFDVVITNPPFSMEYKAKDIEQKKILQQYELSNNASRTLRAGVMFIERYYGLLKPGGKLITVIDNTILNSDQYDYVRDYIREKFIIKAVVSLHGDAFQQSKARVKTSLIYLVKKNVTTEQQPDAFMAFSTCLGVDDKPITTKPSIIKAAREDAEKEISKLIESFHEFENGGNGEFRISSCKLNDKLDVKHCIPLKGRYITKWQDDGYSIKRLDEIFNEVKNPVKPSKEREDEIFKILTIKYDGYCSIEEERIGSEIEGSGTIVHEGDIVFSRYNAYYGAVGYVTDEFDGAFASNSYIVLKPQNITDGLYAWSVLRTAELRADILDSAVGMGRSTIKWEQIRDICIPYIPDDKERQKIANKVFDSWKIIKQAKLDIEKLKADMGNLFGTESEDSLFRFNANKPPK